MTNLEKAQIFVLGQCLSDYPDNMSYEKICKLYDKGSRKVIPWEPFEYLDVTYVMDNFVSAVERLLNEQDEENANNK